MVQLVRLVGLVRLVQLVRLVGLVRLVQLVRLVGLVGLVRLVQLVRLVGLVELVKLVRKSHVPNSSSVRDPKKGFLFVTFSGEKIDLHLGDQKKSRLEESGIVRLLRMGNKP